MVKPVRKTIHSPAKSPSVQPVPQWVSPVNTFCQNGWSFGFEFFSEGQPFRPNVRYAHRAMGPKYRPIIGYTRFIMSVAITAADANPSMIDIHDRALSHPGA